MSAACKDCPFRKNSKLGYVQEGFDALEEDRQPECHNHVGHGTQFNNPLHGHETECVGFHAYTRGEPGFVLPYLEKKSS